MSTFMFLVVILIIALVLFAFVSGGNKRGRRRPNTPKGRSPLQHMSRDQVRSRWMIIEGMSVSGGNGLRQAVSEADKLLDQVMRQQGAGGETMGDRLRSFNSRFSDRDSVWRAHKLRNALAHEVGFDLVPSQAKEALTGFRRALTDLGAL